MYTSIGFPIKALQLILLAGLLSARISAAQTTVSPSLQKQFEEIISSAMHAQQIPAMTVAIAQADRVIYSKAFGMADLENSVPATTETLIRTASIAKAITAVAAMTLTEQGKLDLDAPVQTYCPPFPLKQWPITTRELLSHTSGIRHYRPQEVLEGDNTHHYKWMADGFSIFAADPLLFQPGTGFSYSILWVHGGWLRYRGSCRREVSRLPCRPRP